MGGIPSVTLTQSVVRVPSGVVSVTYRKGPRVRLADVLRPAPRAVRAAGVIAALPGLASLVFAIVLVVAALSGDAAMGGNNIYGEAAYYALLGVGLLACGAGLLLGHQWARSPAVVIAVLMLGIGWYAAGPSARPELGVPVVVLGVLLLVLLFRAPSREWAAQDGAER